MIGYKEEPETIMNKTKKLIKFINIEIQKVFYHAMGRLLNNKKWINKYKPREMSDEKLLKAIDSFLELTPTGILEQRFGLDLGDVTKTMPSESQETKRKPAKK